VKWKQFVKDYLNFTRRERIAVLVISILMALVIVYPEISSGISPKKRVDADTSWFATVRSLEQKNPDSFLRNRDTDEENYAYQYDRKKGSYSHKSEIKAELFYFDPNTISPGEWKKLGLRDRTIQTIQNYLSKGGKFKKPEDLRRVYGLHQNEYERLASYIRIEESVEEKRSESFISADESRAAKTYSSNFKAIDINLADTTAFIALPGIGSKLASRIVSFRDKLGGFYSIEQIKETYGLSDSTFQKIKQYLKLDNTSLKKININTATVDELKAHPYIKYSLANPIVAYRNEHGLFTKVEDIKKVMVITEEIYKKIECYLTVD
jgi:competence ComEA-like helix-hairpin-helix protein